MITLEELWYAWCDIGERDKWRIYDKAIVSVFSAIQANQASVTQYAFDKVIIILKR